VGFADGDGECVELVEERAQVFLRIGGEGSASELDEGVVAGPILSGWRDEESVTLGDAAEIFVGDGDGVAEGVEKDGVGGFRTNAGELEQTAAQGGRGRGGEAMERAGEFLVEHGDEGFERGRFAREETGWANEFLETVERKRAEAGQAERTGGTEIGEGAFDGFPGGVLREVSAEDNLKTCAGGPPVLRTIAGEEAIVHAAQALCGSEGHASRHDGKSCDGGD